MNVYEQVKQALQDIVAPEIRALQVEIKRLDERINSLEDKMVSGQKGLDDKITSGLKGLDEKLVSGLKGLDDKMTSGFKGVDSEIKRLDEKIDVAIQIRERLASLEAKVSALTK